MIKGLEYLVGKSVYGNTFKYFHRGKVLYLKIEKNGLNINDNVKILFNKFKLVKEKEEFYLECRIV